MAAARGSGTGLGDLNLDTSGGIGNDAASQVAGGRAGGRADGLDRELTDPWARFAEQLDWDELQVVPTEIAPAVPVSSAVSPAADRLPVGPVTAPPAATAPPPPPPPSTDPAALAAPETAGAAVRPPIPIARLAAEPAPRVRSAAVELPTEAARLARPAAGPQERWRERAQELGLRSVFLSAVDDFPDAALPASGPPLRPAPAPLASKTPGPALPAGQAAIPPPAVAATNEPLPPPGPATALPHSVAATYAPSLAQGPEAIPHRSVAVTATPLPPAGQKSPRAVDAARRQSSAPIAPVPARPVEPASNRLLGASHRTGSLLRTLQRPTAEPPVEPAAAPLAQEPATPIAALPTPALPTPALPTPALPPPAALGTSVLAAEAVQVVRKSLLRGKTLLRQFLGSRDAAAPPPKDPDAP